MWCAFVAAYYNRSDLTTTLFSEILKNFSTVSINLYIGIKTFLKDQKILAIQSLILAALRFNPLVFFRYPFGLPTFAL